MNTSVTTTNGMVVVTQVFPQDENGKISFPVENVTPSVPNPSPAPAPSVKVSEMTKMFLRGEPLSLGIVQIFIGLMCMIVSLSAIISPTQFVQTPFSMAVAFVVSGSVAVAAHKGTSPCMIQATLAVNLISVLVSLAGTGYVSFLLATRTYDNFCDPNDMNMNLNMNGTITLDVNGRWARQCREMMWTLNNILAGVRGLVLVFMVLEVCVAVTVCVFSGKAIARRGVYSHSSPLKVSVDTCSVPVTSAPSVCDSEVALLDGCVEEAVSTPPPYYP